MTYTVTGDDIPVMAEIQALRLSGYYPNVSAYDQSAVNRLVAAKYIVITIRNGWKITDAGHAAMVLYYERVLS